MTKWLISLLLIFNPLFSGAHQQPFIFRSFLKENLARVIQFYTFPHWEKNQLEEKRKQETKSFAQMPTPSSTWLQSISFLDQWPYRNWDIPSFTLQAKAGLAIDLNTSKILFQKNIDSVRPIASLTKLMTGLIILEKADLNQKITITEEDLAGYGRMGDLQESEIISVKNLLYALFLESSNDAAFALARTLGQEKFVRLMNQKAQELNLEKTHFIDPSGYEPENVSTPWELAQLIKYSLKYPLLWEILGTTQKEIYSPDGKVVHYWRNTNRLLGKWPNIIGGKTGYTEEAGGCLFLVTKIKNHYFAFVILGSENKFREMEALLKWTEEAYRFR